MNVTTAIAGALARETDLLYGKLVRQDYLEHDAIADEVVKVVDRISPVGRVLDLGSGDAEVMTRVARRREIGEYFAVDRKPYALDRVAERLHDLVADVRLFQEDMLEFLWSTSFDFDLILMGYALNCMDSDEKRALLQVAKTRLKPGGVLVVYDAFKQPGQSRQDCIEGYGRVLEDNSVGLQDSEIAAVKTHIRSCEPEDFDTFCRMLARAGLLADPESRWTGKNPYHELICARRP